jgi:pyruvate carboxylase
MAKELEKGGAQILAIKDMAGLLRPFAARRLVKALREAVGCPSTCTPTTPRACRRPRC